MEIKEAADNKAKFDIMHLSDEVFIEADPVTIYRYFHETELFTKWFNSFIVRFTPDSQFLKLGMKIMARFFPPLWFKLEIIAHKEFEYLESAVTGCMQGFVRISIQKMENGCLVRHVMDLTGSNLFYHLYYKALFVFGHNLYLPFVFRKLKKMVNAEITQKRRNN